MRGFCALVAVTVILATKGNFKSIIEERHACMGVGFVLNLLYSPFVLYSTSLQVPNHICTRGNISIDLSTTVEQHVYNPDHYQLQL